MDLFSSHNPHFPTTLELKIGPGDRFELPIQCPMSAGYTPSVAVEGEGVSARLEPVAVPLIPGEPLRVGAPSTTHLVLEASSPGRSQVTITLSRPWLSPDPTASHHTLDVCVQ